MPNYYYRTFNTPRKRDDLPEMFGNTLTTKDRSTLPLVAYWADGGNISHILEKMINTSEAETDKICFEFEHERQGNAGEPGGHQSATDLVYQSVEYIICVESKWTEPFGKSIHQRMVEPRDAQTIAYYERALGVEGVDSELKERRLYSLPYQLLHRLASAARFGEGGRNVFMLFQFYFPVNDNGVEKIRVFHDFLQEARSPLRYRLWYQNIYGQIMPRYYEIEPNANFAARNRERLKEVGALFTFDLSRSDPVEIR